MPSLNPANWYWIVGGSTTQLYSSAAGDYVPVTDPTYQAWVSANALPGGISPASRIGSEAELGAILASYLQRPAAVNVLDGYKDSQAVGIVNAVQFKVLFNHENRLRAIERALSLNGSPTDLTAAQAKAAVKALM